MKNHRALIESSQSAEEIFKSITEVTAAGNIPRVGDQVRLLAAQGSFSQGDTVEVQTLEDTSDAQDWSSFKMGVEGGELSFDRSDIDGKF